MNTLVRDSSAVEMLTYDDVVGLYCFLILIFLFIAIYFSYYFY